MRGILRIRLSGSRQPSYAYRSGSTRCFLLLVIPCDETIDGVRYLQHPLAYPQEWRGRQYILAQIV